MIIVGDCRKELQRLPRDYVQTVCTSPPYYGQRDYDIDGQIGRDQSLNEYIADIVDALSAVRGVLKPDGTVWLNIGDTYASSPPGNKTRGLDKWKTSGLHGAATSEQYADTLDGSQMLRQDTVKGSGRKPKNLLMVPARVAIALQDDGWILRSDIIWAKSSCLPESVRDRPTRSHEYVFLLAKSQKLQVQRRRHQDAVRQPVGATGEPPHRLAHQPAVIQGSGRAQAPCRIPRGACRPVRQGRLRCRRHGSGSILRLRHSRRRLQTTRAQLHRRRDQRLLCGHRYEKDSRRMTVY